MKKLQGKLLFDPPEYLEPNKISKKSDFEFIRKLGDGSYSQVWRAKHKKSKKFFAIKQVQKSKVTFILYQFFREVEILYKLSHPHIIKLFTHFEDDKYFYLIFELMEGGTLFHKLYREKFFSEPVAAQFFREIVLAVEYMHLQAPGIVHRDIKPENIMLDKDLRVKLIDFGWSNFVEDCESRKTYCGTAEYMPPEMIKKNGHGLEIDIWCLGILLHEMLLGYTPFRSTDRNTLYKLIIEGRFKLPEKLSLHAKNLITQMLETDLTKRPQISKVKSSHWLQSISPIRNSLEVFNTECKKQRLNYKIEYTTEATNSSDNEKEFDQCHENQRNNAKKIKEKIKKESQEAFEVKKKLRETESLISEEEEKITELESAIFDKKREALRFTNSIKKLLSKGFDYNLELEMLQDSDVNELLDKKCETESKLLDLTKKCKFNYSVLESLRKEVSKESMACNNHGIQLSRLRITFEQLQSVHLSDHTDKKSSENELKRQIETLKHELSQHSNQSSNFSHSELSAVKEITALITSKLQLSQHFVPEIENRLEIIQEKLHDCEQLINELDFSYKVKKCLIINKFQCEKARILQRKNRIRMRFLDNRNCMNEENSSSLKQDLDIVKNLEITYEKIRVLCM